MNLPLARRVLDALRTKPHLHDQSVWREDRAEGVAHCVAGWTVELSGAVWGPLPGLVSWRGKLRSIPVLAGDLLGLDPAQARELCYLRDEAEVVAVLARWVEQSCVHQHAQLVALQADFYRAS
ncbi:hypothetical protein ACWEO2_17885 [Nocardia sp. NPDC004278]